MRRILVAILASAMLLGLVGCMENGGDTSLVGKTALAWQEQYDLGIRYLSEGNYQEAIIAFTAAIEIDPKRAEAYIGRGGAYIGSGETAENLAAALADYEQAAALDETNPDAYLGMADVYIRMGEYDKAYQVLKDGLDKTGGDQSIADKIAEIESGQYIDSAGYQRRMVYHAENGSVLWWHDFTLNESGQRVKTTVFDAAGNQVDQWDGYQYDSQGRILRSAGYSFTTGEFTTISESIYEGNVIVRTDHYGMEGDSRGYFLYDYDDNENRIKTICYGGDDTLSFYWVHQYDEAGNEIRVDYYRPDGTSYGHCERTYDETGNQTGFYSYDENGYLEGYTEG